MFPWQNMALWKSEWSLLIASTIEIERVTMLLRFVQVSRTKTMYRMNSNFVISFMTSSNSEFSRFPTSMNGDKHICELWPFRHERRVQHLALKGKISAADRSLLSMRVARRHSKLCPTIFSCRSGIAEWIQWGGGRKRLLLQRCFLPPSSRWLGANRSSDRWPTTFSSGRAPTWRWHKTSP